MYQIACNAMHYRLMRWKRIHIATVCGIVEHHKLGLMLATCANA